MKQYDRVFYYVILLRIAVGALYMTILLKYRKGGVIIMAADLLLIYADLLKLLLQIGVYAIILVIIGALFIHHMEG